MEDVLLFPLLSLLATSVVIAAWSDYERVAMDVLGQEETAGCDVALFYDRTSVNMASSLLRDMAHMEHPKVVTVHSGTGESAVKMARAKNTCMVDVIWGADHLIAKHMALAKSFRGTTVETDFYLAVPTGNATMHEREEYGANEFKNFAVILKQDEENGFVLQTFCLYSNCATSSRGTLHDRLKWFPKSGCVSCLPLPIYVNINEYCRAAAKRHAHLRDEC